MSVTKLYNVGEFDLLGTVGTWVQDLTSNVRTYKKMAGNDTSVISIQVPKYNGGAFWQNAPSILKVTYTVVTTALDAAPTAVLNENNWASATGVTTRSAVTQAITFGGVDATGTAAGAGADGTHVAIVTITTPTQLTDAESLFLELTLNAAIDTDLRIQALEVTYA